MVNYKKKALSTTFWVTVPKQDFKLNFKRVSANLPVHCASMDTHEGMVSTTFYFQFEMGGGGAFFQVANGWVSKNQN